MLDLYHGLGSPLWTPSPQSYLILLPQVTVALAFYGFPNKVQPKVLNPEVHVSKPDNEASERKEGGLRFAMRTEKEV